MEMIASEHKHRDKILVQYGRVVIEVWNTQVSLQIPVDELAAVVKFQELIEI